VKGVQVEEIYDLQKAFEGNTYGFIFLFRWIEERRSRRKTITEDEQFVTDPDVVNSIFFAQQMIPNSCATHALLSVLLNCEKVTLGETLAHLKTYSSNMNPENKGYAIGNIPELARAHNSHARKEVSHLPEKLQGMTVRTMEAFHFVSYVPINGHLFELDGLKPYPIDHGPWDKNEEWTEKFRNVITERLGMATGGEPYHDIRFNLMAVVPDKVSLYEHKLSTLKTNRQIVLEALQQMVKVTTPGITLAEQEKCLAAVKKRDPSVSVDIVAMDTSESSNIKEHESVQAPVIDLTEHSNDNDITMECKGDNGAPSQSPDVDVESHDSPLECGHKTESVAVKTEQSNPECGHKTESVAVKTEVSHIGVQHPKEEKQMAVQASISAISSAVSTLTDTTSSSTDVTKPLMIETKFSGSPGPSSASTDTASEVGSCFSSPSSSIAGTSAQNSPNVPDGNPSVKSEVDAATKPKTKLHSQKGFRPKDLIALLKNVENEIQRCETNLQEEQEKIKKYKIDNCRRTHNYDQFLCTFLSMLAQQGHLAELVQQHSLIKKRVPGHISKSVKLSQAARKKKKTKKRR
ncbi:hypothetical protein DPMN_118384, partial [Dreissena polymorpha]